MAYSIEHLSEQIFKLIKGFGFTIVLFTDDGKKTANPQEARRFFAKDIQMMVNFIANETASELVVNISSSTDIKKIKSLLDSLRNLATENIIEYTVKSFGKNISPKDFAYQAKSIGESTMEEAPVKKNRSILADDVDDLNGYANHGYRPGRPGVTHVTKISKTTDKAAYDGVLPHTAGNIAKGPDSEIDRPNATRIKKVGIAPVERLRYSDSHNRNKSGYIDKSIGESTMDRKNKTRANNKPTPVIEGFSGWRGTARKSVNELGDARLIVMHSRNVDETARGSRTRQIESIFIESGSGERFKFPGKSLSAAKAMVRHVKEGGTPYDDFGQYIYETLEELTQLRKFQRKNRRNDFFEDANIGSEIGNRVGQLRSNLIQMSGPKGYAHHFESFCRNKNDVEPEKLEELKNNVTVKYFDESISGSLPYVARIIEAMRTRQEKQAEIIEFAQYVMDNKDNIQLNKEIDPVDPENPEGRKFRDPATAFAAWVTFLTPHIQDDILANLMMKVSDVVFEVDSKHLNVAAAALNVIRQRGKVLASAGKRVKASSIMADSVTHISESIGRYANLRKLFG
jgi:hypothetical protein